MPALSPLSTKPPCGEQNRAEGLLRGPPRAHSHLHHTQACGLPHTYRVKREGPGNCERPGPTRYPTVGKQEWEEPCYVHTFLDVPSRGTEMPPCFFVVKSTGTPAMFVCVCSALICEKYVFLPACLQVVPWLAPTRGAAQLSLLGITATTPSPPPPAPAPHSAPPHLSIVSLA